MLKTINKPNDYLSLNLDEFLTRNNFNNWYIKIGSILDS